MNFKNRHLVMGVRILLGLFLVFSSVTGFLSGYSLAQGNPDSGVPEDMVGVTMFFWETGITHLAKLIELVVGIMLIFNLFPAFAAVMLAPITTGIVVINIFMLPAMLVISMPLFLLNLYFGYVYWDKYRPLFNLERKKKTK